MKLEDILNAWDKDGPLNTTDINDTTQNIPKLHHKYLRWFSSERLILRKLESDLRKLKLEKYEFYTQGPNKETMVKGWKLPPRGSILKVEVTSYLEADNELNDLQLRIAYQQEKVDTLKEIIEQINKRTFLIGHWISYTKWVGGSG